MAKWRIPGLAARPRFTSRATVLVLVLCSLVAILAYPARQYIAQRGEIADQRAKAEHARRQVDELRREKARWQDPEYVKAQARERLHYALPGETPFVSVSPPPAPGAKPSSTDAAAGRPKAVKPWYAALWDSVDAADAADAAPAPRPAP
ncbi:cell division protein FtsB [Kitasatospora sp. SolWspMP-SS2h]|uniref:FtsB family cell division protein n=1 Tax=Kitasatospora sp. SolWspMP-SS2h TaxID=1305729 RepID=UPI000DC0338D|nr:septum formation initiator family protein [Kitasatospora sp. SolWspMP-SS2h]RAJ36033.1 cell division protein FtsB [Kitasatospora sp. SolWspMP-SS2h]